MKKNLVIILAMLVMGITANAEELTAINEADGSSATENKSEETVFDTTTIPSLNDVDEKIQKDAESQNQINTARSIADIINSSLQKEEMQSQIIKEFSGQIMNVDDCVKIALANHPAILSSKSSAEIYKSKIAQAWSAFFPKVGIGLDYSRNDMLLTGYMAKSNIPRDDQRYNMFYLPTANINWLLFDFGKTKAEVDIARKVYQASEDNVQKSINDVIFNVKKCYYNLLFAIQQEKVYTDSVNDYTAHLEQAKAFYSIGTKAKIDVLTAEYNLGKAKLDLIKAKNNVKLAFADVNNAIGMPEFTDYSIEENLETRTYEVLLDDMLDTAFKTRPEYLAAKKKAEGSKILVKATKRAFLPDLKAYGTFQYGGINPGADSGYQVGANLAYSNFNALLLKKQVDEAKSTAKRDLADLETQRQKIYLEVKQAYIDLQNAKESIPVSALAMVQAKEQYDLASGRYQVGMGDAVELKDAENTYIKAQLEYYSNLMQYNISAANLERVTGAPIEPEIHEQM